MIIQIIKDMKNNLLLVLFLFISVFLNGQNYPFDEDDIIDWEQTTFDTLFPVFIELDTSAQNIWQVGQPSKSLFTSALTPPNALVTDTLNSYPMNVNSWFEVNWFEVPFIEGWDGIPFNIFFEIHHRFDTDSLRDGGYITVSYDNGLTWTNVIQDYIFGGISPAWDENDSLYTQNDTLYNGEFGFSGQSDGWITTRFAWYYMPVRIETDTMRIRFNFISDAIPEEKDGWMIDNFAVYTVDVGGSVNEYQMNDFSVYPNPVSDRLTLDFDRVYTDLDISIQTIKGEVILNRKIRQQKAVEINNLNLPSGNYIVTVRSAVWQRSKVIVVK